MNDDFTRFILQLFIEPFLIESRHSDTSMRTRCTIACPLMHKVTVFDLNCIRHRSLVFHRLTKNIIVPESKLTFDSFMISGS